MASWQRSGNILLEKIDLRDVNVATEDDTLVVLSRFGGPIATFTKKDRTVRVYAGGGKFIASFQCPSSPCSGGFGWTEDLVLVLVCDDAEGSVFVWDDFAGPTSRPRKLKITFGHAVKLVVLWGTSVVALTQKMALLVLNEIRKAPKLKWAPIVFPIVNFPLSMCILCPELTLANRDANLEVAVALVDQPGMLVANPEKKSVDARVPQFRALPSRLLASHPVDPIIASLDVNDRLLVLNSTWDEILYARDCQLGSGFQSIPIGLAWCMGGPGYCVVALWDETPWSPIIPGQHEEGYSNHDDVDNDQEVKFGPGALALGFLPDTHITIAASKVEDRSTPATSVARYSFSAGGRLAIISEVDGLRIFSGASRKMQLIRRVSRSTQALDAIGSLSPAAMLVECMDDELALAGIPDEDLISGVDDLLDCVVFESDIERKLQLLRAAQHGKDRIMRSDDQARLAKKFAEVCQITRGLTFLAEARLSCSTYMQAIALGLQVLAHRIAYLGAVEQANAFSKSMQLNMFPIDLLEARITGTNTLAEGSKLVLPGNSEATNLSSAKANAALTAMSKLLFRSENFLRSDGAAALGLSCALQGQQQSLDPASARELLLRLCEFESRLSRKIICLLQLQELDRVLGLLDSSRGVDFDLKSRAALFCLNRNPNSQPESKVMSHLIAEQAVRASLRSMRNVVKLEKWLIAVSSNKALSQERRSKASHERGLLLLETAMFTADISMELKKKAVLIQEAAKEFELAGKTFLAQQAKDYSQLISIQDELAVPVGKSIVQTIQDCVSRGRDDMAERFRKQFNVKPHLFWRAKIRGMGRRGLWMEAARLTTLQKEVGRCVSVEDVLEMCFDAGADSAASRITFELLDDANPERARAFVRLRLWKEALLAAVKSRCLDAAQDIALRCRDGDISKKASDFAEELRRNLATASELDGSSENGKGLFGLVTGAVKVEPQRCQQQ